MSDQSRTGWDYTNPYEFMEMIQQGYSPLIICCACNGGIQGKEYSEHIPETPDEIADSVFDAYQAGASMVHVHARNPEKIWDAARSAEAWREVNRAIRERCPDIIVNNTTGASFGMNMEERLACLDANPEVASLNLLPDMSRFKLKARPEPFLHPRPEVEIDDCIPFTYGLVEHFATEIQTRGIRPEIEIYATGGNSVLRDLIRSGLVTAPYWVQTVMGYQGASWPTVDNVFHLVREFPEPENTVWLLSGMAHYQLPLTTLAILMGGHVRVGLEDNLYLRRGEKGTNADFVSRAARISHELNREVATPAQARQMLGLSQEPSVYT